MSFNMALVVTLVAVLPFLVLRKIAIGAIIGGVILPILLLIFYAAIPSLVWGIPWSAPSALVLAVWLVSAIICSVYANEHQEPRLYHAWWFIGVGLLALGGRGCSGWSAFRSSDYAGLIGEVETREWTQDVQPADPRHIRQVSDELASFLADKQLGTAPGAIGSQFEVSKPHLTL